MVRKSRLKAEERHTDPVKKKQAEAGRKANVRGKSEERTLVKKLAAWWDPDGKYEWKRTPGSGGSPLKEEFDLAGDICTTHPDFIFHVEIKKDKRFDKLDKILTTSKWDFWDFIRQSADDCPRHRYPILIFMNPGPSQPKFMAFWRTKDIWPHVALLFHEAKVDYIQASLHRDWDLTNEVQSLVVCTLNDFMSIDKEKLHRVFSIGLKSA